MLRLISPLLCTPSHNEFIRFTLDAGPDKQLQMFQKWCHTRFIVASWRQFVLSCMRSESVNDAWCVLARHPLSTAQRRIRLSLWLLKQAHFCLRKTSLLLFNFAGYWISLVCKYIGQVDLWKQSWLSKSYLTIRNGCWELLSSTRVALGL